jgi:hypothetical protein
MKKILFVSALFLFISESAIAQKRTRSTQSRSAKTGQYTTKSYADKHKSTTYTTTKKKNQN